MASQKHAGTFEAAPTGFGAWLRGLREAKNLAQRTVAAAADMDSSHYGKVESGKRLPKEAQVGFIARQLGVSAAEIKARLVAARLMAECDGDFVLASQAAGFVQEAAAPYFANNPAHKPVNKLRATK